MSAGAHFLENVSRPGDGRFRPHSLRHFHAVGFTDSMGRNMRTMVRAASRMSWRVFVIAVWACASARAVGADVDYDRTIRPLFAERCSTCHSEEEKSSGFSVADLPARARRG